MARTLDLGSKTALTGNTDLEMHFDFQRPADPEDVKLSDMKSRTHVKYDDGSKGVMPRVNVAAALDSVATVSGGTELSNFLATLAKLRDAGFDAGNLPDV